MTTPPPIVAIDSQILGWYVQDQTANNDPRVMQARWLIDELVAAGAQIIIPSVALSEFLHPVPEQDRKAAWSAISEIFHVAPHDAHAAEIGAKLATTALARPRQAVGDRQVAKADAQIVASAKAAGATIFYSNDEGCRDLAKSVGMDARDLPTTPPTLFQYPRE